MVTRMSKWSSNLTLEILDYVWSILRPIHTWASNNLQNNFKRKFQNFFKLPPLVIATNMYFFLACVSLLLKIVTRVSNFLRCLWLFHWRTSNTAPCSGRRRWGRSQTWDQSSWCKIYKTFLTCHLCPWVNHINTLWSKFTQSFLSAGPFQYNGNN